MKVGLSLKGPLLCRTHIDQSCQPGSDPRPHISISLWPLSSLGRSRTAETEKPGGFHGGKRGRSKTCRHPSVSTATKRSSKHAVTRATRKATKSGSERQVCRGDQRRATGTSTPALEAPSPRLPPTPSFALLCPGCRCHGGLVVA